MEAGAATTMKPTGSYVKPRATSVNGSCHLLGAGKRHVAAQHLRRGRLQSSLWGSSSSLELRAAAAAAAAGRCHGSPGHSLEKKRGSKKRHGGVMPCSAEYEELAGVLVFSAFPFVAVKALANSDVGESLMRSLEGKRRGLEAERVVREVARERAQMESPWYGESRPRFLGFLPFAYPSYLDGKAAGDFGFDPLGLAAKKEDFERYYNLEILHARWAMLAALGVLVPELLQRYQGVDFLEPVWWKVGYAKLLGGDLDYLGIPGLHIAGAQGVAIIAVAQFLLMLGPEFARGTGIKALEPLGIYLPGDINYPGGWLFDPLGISNNAKLFEDMKVREMKNGRLAMLAWLGFPIQAYVTETGPLDNWIDFVENPSKNNILALFYGDLGDNEVFAGFVRSMSQAVEVVERLGSAAISIVESSSLDLNIL